MGFLHFIREVGKHITVNYMMAKDSVKTRLETGISFTEFSYQLVQGYDYVHLNKTLGCTLQMGGSDQWGTSPQARSSSAAWVVARPRGDHPLLTKADGSKFGKSEGGNIWLDAQRSSPYKFYQFWLNSSDADAPRFIRIFSTRGQEELEALIVRHAAAPHKRTCRRNWLPRSLNGYTVPKNCRPRCRPSEILFGNATAQALAGLSEQQWLDVFEGVPQAEVSRDALAAGIPIVDLLSEVGGFLPSKGEARRALKENSIAVNKEKVGEERMVNADDLMGGRFILLQRGKKNYFLVISISKEDVLKRRYSI
jgi:tyrosyl-tRNA synthetase